jgi:hypothetical protein
MIQRRFWNAPLHVPRLMVRSTVNRVTAEQRTRIEGLL